MARLINQRDQAAILAAADHWVQGSLVKDQSVFTRADIWSVSIVGELTKALSLLGRSEKGGGSFLDRLKQQIEDTSPPAKRLVAEMVWALLLFPSNITPAKKRDQVCDLWAMSGEPLDPEHELLRDAVLIGIGSGGPGFNNYRPLELAFLMRCTASLKAKNEFERKGILTDYDAFLGWIEEIEDSDRRQFRHMLRYFLFPDRVERIASSSQWWKVLEGFGVGNKSELRNWSDRQIDEATYALRQKLEREYPGRVLDFYESPLKARWQADEEDDDGVRADAPGASKKDSVTISRDLHSAGNQPVNLIVFGPPGTGKTHWLRRQQDLYTDAPSAVDRETWLQELLGNHGWRAVIACALNDIGHPVRVPELRDHLLIIAKAKERGRATLIQATLWNYLQEHTPERVETVKSTARRPPFVFSKRKSGEWELVEDWRSADEEANDLANLLKAGPAGAQDPVKRYRTITFHPSFGYEDFIRGIRPVALDEEGTTEFRMVDGVFKRLCDQARANPTRRYACFIDEINRANIAKVFGELITLIEIDKRAQFDDDGRLVKGMVVELPGSTTANGVEPPFGVPANLDIYGTMNTADRSIALLDIALRRRFEFKEMEPDYLLVDRMVDDVDLGRLLAVINERLEYLIDRDHRIGHAYLMAVHTLTDLQGVFAQKIVPLLQEYFFDDFSKIAAVLRTSAGKGFVKAETISRTSLFGSESPAGILPEARRFSLTLASEWTAASFRGLYFGDAEQGSDLGSAGR